MNPLQNREKNRGQRKKTTTTKRGAQKRLQNCLFFYLSPIYQQDQCMEMVMSTSVTTFLISSSLAPCSASFLPSCSFPFANGVVFSWILKTYKETQKKRVQKTTTTAAEKHKIVARKIGAKVVCRECVDARRARSRRSSYHGNVPGSPLCPVRCCPRGIWATGLAEISKRVTKRA